MRVRLRRKPSAPVSSCAARSQHRALDAPARRCADPAAGLADALRPATELSPAKKSRNSGGISGDEPAAEVDVEAEALVAAAQRDHALGDAVAVGVEREGDVDVVERARALQPQVDRRLALDLQERRDHAALRLLQVPGRASSCRVCVGEGRRRASARRPARRGARCRGSVSSAPPRQGQRAAGAQSSAAWPKTGSAKVMLGRSSSRRRIATGSSGSAKGWASASAAAAPGLGRRARRGAASRRARPRAG